MSLTALNLNCAVLRVKWVVVQVHHTGECRGEPHAVSDGSVTVQPDHLVLLGDVVQEAVLVVGEERVGHPDLLRKVAGEGEDPVLLGAEAETLVFPILVQVHCNGVVL